MTRLFGPEQDDQTSTKWLVILYNERIEFYLMGRVDSARRNTKSIVVAMHWLSNEVQGTERAQVWKCDIGHTRNQMDYMPVSILWQRGQSIL